MGASDVLGGSNNPLPVLGRARPVKAVCDVSSQHALYCSSLKVNKNLVVEEEVSM